jgi:hypothetical protein
MPVLLARGPDNMLRCLAVASVDAVGLTVATLPAHVGAKRQRAVGWICVHERKHHRP